MSRASADHELGEADAHARDGDAADHDAGAGAGHRHQERVPRPVLERFEHRLPGDVLARDLAHEGHRKAGEGAGQSAQRGAVARDQPDEDNENGHEQVPALAHHRPEARQLGLGHAQQADALGFEVHREEHRDVVQDRRDGRPERHLEVAHRQELGHHECGRAHHRRHDLAAGGGDRLDRRGERRRKAGSFHQRNGDRPVDHHVGDRAARHRAEQGRADHRNLARTAGGMAGDREGEVHEQLAGAAPLHERAEQHEQHHVGGRHAQRRAEDALGGEIELLHQHRQLHVGQEPGV